MGHFVAALTVTQTLCLQAPGTCLTPSLITQLSRYYTLRSPEGLYAECSSGHARVGFVNASCCLEQVAKRRVHTQGTHIKELTSKGVCRPLSPPLSETQRTCILEQAVRGRYGLPSLACCLSGLQCIVWVLFSDLTVLAHSTSFHIWADEL